MSLWRAEHVCVALAPDAVSCALWPGRGAAHPTARAVLPCAHDAAAPAWRPALDALRGWVASIGPLRGEVRVVLSNHFVRYLVVPWQDTLSSDAEREAFARHLFHERHGELASHWHLKLAGAGYGDSALACAVDRELHRALPDVFVGTRLRLQAVEPLLMVAFNRFRRELGKDAALFVREPGRLCCAVVAGGQWRTVHAARADAERSSDALVARATHVLGLAPDVPLFLYDTAGGDAPERDDAHGYRVLRDAAARRGDRALALLAHAEADGPAGAPIPVATAPGARVSA